MSFKPRTWLVISLLCFFGAAVFWDLGRKEAARRKTPAEPTPATPTATSAPSQAASSVAPTLLSAAIGKIEYVSSNRFSEPAKARYPHRLRNSDTKLQELSRRDDALLLANALLDLRQPLALSVPESLQQKGPTESYVVQSKVALDRGFRELLTAFQAEIVSYVPNNALLVRMDNAKAERIRQSPLVRSVVPWIPYFKLSPTLLKEVVSQQPSSVEKDFRLLVFPKESEAVLAELGIMSVEVLGQSRSPFGTEIMVRASSSRLADLAQNDRVQWIDPFVKRKAANDLTGISLGTSTNGGLDTQYLGLTGKGIRVNVNDTGVDETNPDLAGRVLDGEPVAHFDLDGHGTHVAGIIASSGKTQNFPQFGGTNMPPGSATNATFQGKAPEASIIPALIDPFFGSFLSDSYLQETVALNDALISNNSWGYLGVNEYDSAAASYDAAVRDALPLVSGQQSITFVFAAGNSGAGDNDGLGGDGDSISTPATAKNVITVGALESLRRITNGPVSTNASGELQTNSFFYADTDSISEIADYSSRGNVGINQEGDFGRFKPDVVAPGSFIISTRSVDWKDPAFQVDQIPLFQRNQTVDGLATNFYTLQIPDNSIQVSLRAIPNPGSPVPFPGLLIGVRKDFLPPPNTFLGTNFLRFPVTGGGNWVIAIQNPTNFVVAHDLIAVITVTNPAISSEYFSALKSLNDQVEPFYRYESGTSMAAPAISGMIALMHEFFTNRLNYPLPSPALTKAMLINGSDTVGDLYDFQVNSTLNLQGWGKPELPRIIPKVMDSKPTNPDSWPVRFYDQTNNAALATGESQTRTLTFSPTNAFATLNDLRVTLVWTDPPGNPGVGIKLVNDLDLVVTNLNSGEVYYGNDIKAESVYNDPVDTGITNATDVVNNVENVFISGPLGDKYSITVVAKRVNVNAVTTEPTEISQDYALVVSIGDRRIEDGFKIDEPVGPRVQSGPALVSLTNEVPLMTERVGANPSVSPSTNGVLPQWRFYEFVNKEATNPYVAIMLLNGFNLAKPRLAEGDIDIYVSTDPGLLNLDPLALAQCVAQGDVSGDQLRGASRSRNSTEFVAFTNSAPGTRYFIAVKSEDQQALEYAILAVARSEPFDSDENGCRMIHFVRVPTPIPDGANELPAGIYGVQPALFIGVSTRRIEIANASVDMRFRHEDTGDLVSVIKGPQGPLVTLFSHSINSSNGPAFDYNLSIDDSNTRTNRPPGSFVYASEGPIGLQTLVGLNPRGVWQFGLYDNSILHTGLVDRVSLCIEPVPPCLYPEEESDPGCLQEIGAYEWRYYPVDVPFDATALKVCISENSFPLELYALRGLNRPTTNEWDAFTIAPVTPIGEQSCLVVDAFTTPSPLIPGQYRIGIFNNNPNQQTYRISIRFVRGLMADSYVTFVGQETALSDDAVTYSAIGVATNRLIVDGRVGLRLDHPRVSDLAIRLISPQGTRWLLKENRGNSSPDGLGSTFGVNGLIGPPEQILTNYAWATFTDSAELADTPIKFAAPPLTRVVVESQPIVFESHFDGTPMAHLDQSATFEGWRVSTNFVAVTNDVTLGSTHAHVLALSGGAVVTEVSLRRGRQYQLSFAYRKESSSQVQQITNRVGPLFGAGYEVPSGSPLSIGPAVVVPKFRGSPGQEIHISALTNEIFVAPGIRVSPQGLPALYRGLRQYALVGQWSYSATALSAHTAWGLPFFVGQDAVRPVPDAPGDYYLWLTINDPDHSDNGAVDNGFEVTTRWKPSQLDSFSYSLGGVPKTLFAADYWQTNVVRFIGGSGPSEFRFLGGWNTTTLIDDVVIREALAASYYLAEEPLPRETEYRINQFKTNNPAQPLTVKPAFLGESAEGNWQLEIRDTRAGSGANPPKAARLWSWYLQVLFAPGQQPIPLTNCVEFAGTVRRDGMQLFAVDVPREAVSVRNTIVNGTNLVLLFNPSQTPDPNFDVVTSPFPIAVGPGFVAAGSRYYLGVMNLNPFARGNDFTIRVDFDLPMTTLTNGLPVVAGYGDNLAGFTNTLIAPVGPALPTNILYPGTNMHWYKHVVEPHPALHAVVYELQSANPEIHMVVKRGLADVDYLPTPTDYDYHSINYDTTNEIVIIRTNSFPIGLVPIPWLVGVYNSGTNSSTYSLTATRWTNAPPVGYPVVPHTFSVTTNWNALTNEVGFSLQPGEAMNYFYCFQTAPANSAILVELLSLSGDVDLFLRRNDLPSEYLYDFSDLQRGTNTEHIGIHTNLYVPTFGAPTNWYFNIVNHDSIQATGIVRVAMASGTNAIVSGLPLTLDPGGVSVGTSLTIRWRAIAGERYDIRYDVNPAGTFNNSLGVITASSSTAEFTDPLGVPGSRFYRVIQLGP